MNVFMPVPDLDLVVRMTSGDDCTALKRKRYMTLSRDKYVIAKKVYDVNKYEDAKMMLREWYPTIRLAVNSPR